MIKKIQKYLDKRLGDRITKRFISLDKDLWLYFGHTFNGWEFPVEFYDLIPRWYRRRKKTKRTTDRYMTIYRAVSDLIDLHFTQKEQLRYHNVGCGKKTNDEFEYWWNNFSCRNTYENFDDNTNRTYYERSLFMDSVHWWEDEIFGKIQSALKQKEPQKI